MDLVKLRPIEYATTDDEEFKATVRSFADAYKELGETEELNTAYKIFCNFVRKQNNETRIIGFVGELKNGELLISIYDILATDDNFYLQKFDEEGMPYIEV